MASTTLPTTSMTSLLPIETRGATGTLNLSAPVQEPATLRTGPSQGKQTASTDVSKVFLQKREGGSGSANINIFIWPTLESVFLFQGPVS